MESKYSCKHSQKGFRIKDFRDFMQQFVEYQSQTV